MFPVVSVTLYGGCGDGGECGGVVIVVVVVTVSVSVVVGYWGCSRGGGGGGDDSLCKVVNCNICCCALVKVVVVGVVGFLLLEGRWVVVVCLALPCFRVGCVVLEWHWRLVAFVVASLLLLLCLGQRLLLQSRPH